MGNRLVPHFACDARVLIDDTNTLAEQGGCYPAGHAPFYLRARDRFARARSPGAREPFLALLLVAHTCECH